LMAADNHYRPSSLLQYCGLFVDWMVVPSPCSFSMFPIFVHISQVKDLV
jgi:hypothetical protein